jgi:hypothetical protein
LTQLATTGKLCFLFLTTCATQGQLPSCANRRTAWVWVWEWSRFRELNLLQFKANHPGKSSFQEKKQKEVPWAVEYQNDGLSWISPPLVRRLFVVFGFNIWFWFTRQEPIGFLKYNSLISKHVCIRILSPVPLARPPCYMRGTCYNLLVCVCTIHPTHQTGGLEPKPRFKLP